MNDLNVLNPVAKMNRLSFNLAERPKDLKNLKIAMIWNLKAFGNIALLRIAENLKRSVGHLDITQCKDDQGFSMSTIEWLADSFDAVIGGVGD